jgi:hypothetical protein
VVFSGFFCWDTLTKHSYQTRVVRVLWIFISPFGSFVRTLYHFFIIYRNDLLILPSSQFGSCRHSQQDLSGTTLKCQCELQHVMFLFCLNISCHDGRIKHMIINLILSTSYNRLFYSQKNVTNYILTYGISFVIFIIDSFTHKKRSQITFKTIQ